MWIITVSDKSNVPTHTIGLSSVEGLQSWQVNWTAPQDALGNCCTFVRVSDDTVYCYLLLKQTIKPKLNKSRNNLEHGRSAGSKIPTKEIKFRTELLNQGKLQRALVTYSKMCTCIQEDTFKVKSVRNYGRSYWTTLILRILK